MVVSLIFICTVIFCISKLVYDHQLAKDIEKSIRYNDKMLKDFWYKSKKEKNSEWTKMYYESLYQERLELLRTNK